MGKVKVDKKTYEQLNDYLSSNNKDSLLRFHANGNWVSYSEFNKFNHIELAKILIKGYEVEEEPEEKILDQYKRLRILYHNHKQDYDRGMMNGIIFALNELNIQIEGINK